MSQEYPTVTESKYNIWTSYVIGGLTLAAEYNDAEDLGGTTGKDGTGYLFMANYAWEKFVLTLRYHDWEIENAAGKTTEEMSGFTFSPSYKVNKNLLLVTEYRMDDDHTAANVNVNTYSFEALVTF